MLLLRFYFILKDDRMENAKLGAAECNYLRRQQAAAAGPGAFLEEPVDG